MTTPNPTAAGLLTNIAGLRQQIAAAQAQLKTMAAAFPAGTTMSRDDGLLAVWVTGYNMLGNSRPGWLVLDPSRPNGHAFLDDFNNAPGAGTWSKIR